ncbi:hypothetical protein JTE90_017588 [Oedothorax gibbosus]|uniref:Sulfhydryl oxidase n=1 Tax=Oedothorax gibbosus TaxID=931172 RepID=A0AAV6TL59_9ARAC|nr:hypothetical protein JTE90_017588 [Oedothorax gibbosus]
MKLETYHSFRQAFLGANNPVAMSHIAALEKDPYLIHQTKLLLSHMRGVPWNVEHYTSQFRNAPAKQRLEETLLIFLLHSAMVVKQEIFNRTFMKPGSNDVNHVWVMLFKQCFETLTTLLYKVKWTTDNHKNLDMLVLKLIYQGQCRALRDFMKDELHIPMVTHTTQAEMYFEKLNELHISQMGSSFWRLLHWVAEAMDRPDRDEVAKQSWRTLMTYSLYRFLICGVCRMHMQTIVTELKDQLKSVTVSNRELWFNIHNKVNSIIAKPNTSYSKSELAADAEFMVQAFEE